MNRLNTLKSRVCQNILLLTVPLCLSQATYALDISSVNASADDGNIAENAIDGLLETRWSASGDGQWIQFDLDNSYLIESMNISFYRGDQRDANIDITISEDGESWNTVWSGTTSNRTVEGITFDIEDTNGRYVKVIGYGNSANSWNSITEVDISGTSQENESTNIELSGTYHLKNAGLNSYVTSSNTNLYGAAEFTNNVDDSLGSWELVKTGDYYFIQNTETGYKLRPDDATDFSRMMMAPSNWTGSWTQWSLTEIGEHYRLINRATGKYIRPVSATNNEMMLVPTTYSGTWTQYDLVEATNNNNRCELPPLETIEIPETLSTALDNLNAYISEQISLTSEQLTQYQSAIEENAATFASSSDLFTQAFSIVKSYEDSYGPLFINSDTAGGFSRTADLPLHHTMLSLQQGLIDYAFVDNNIERFQAEIEGNSFATSSYFPGAIDEDAQTNISHTAKINASQQTFVGLPVSYYDVDARRPTGTYLPPGNVAMVTVPDELIGKGFSVRVGAQSWDLSKKSTVTRMDRVSIVYPITCKWTRIANPLGGGIYIDVPYEANAGVVDVTISNVTRSPFFSARSFTDTTTTDEWKTESAYGAPWADFESDNFMMQVPTSWLELVADPEQLMKDWDSAMDAYSELFGVISRSKTALYLQVDTTFRGNANYPGYPQSNYAYNPKTPSATNQHQWLLKGPQYSDWATLHELGHAHLFTKFAGETESAVNLPFVAVMNDKFDEDLDIAFGNSISGMSQVSLGVAASMWMVTANFREGNPMNITNVAGDEVKYQHRGHGKYVAIAKLLGWEPLQKFWRSVNEDYIEGIEYTRNADPIDSRILRMSRAANVDLTPLIHFWGVQPEASVTLAAQISSENLVKSALIYDELQRYKTLIPMSNDEFLTHANVIYPNGLSEGSSSLYGVGWYYVAAQSYTSTEGKVAQVALQNIIDLYFPDGRP